MSNTLSSRAKSAISHRLVRILLSIFLPVTAFGILLITEGKDPIATYGVILNAVFGSRYGFGEVIVKATLLILTSLTAILPYRVGMANAGGEGQMAIGALTAAVAGTTFLRQVPAPIGIPLMLLSGMIGGGIWAGITVLFKMKLRMNETLCSILMNYIATYFISFLLFGILKDAKGWNYPQTSEVASQLRFHTLFGTRANIGILISLATAVFAWYVLQKTKFGFLINTIGGNTRAALYSGLHVKKIQSLLFTVSGAIAGLAGGILIAGVEGRMRVDSGANMGFFGFLAAGIVGNNPLLAILSAFLIAGLTVAGNAMEINTGLPSASIQILMMFVLLTIMALGRRKSHA